MARPPRPSEPDPADATLVDDEWVPGPDRPVLVEEHAPVPPPVRRGPRLWPWLLLLLVLALAGVGAAFYFARDDEESTGGTTQTARLVEVPVLVGLKETRARELLQDLGLDAETRRRAGNKPAGVVVEQRPQSGGRLEEGEPVVLTVSRGPARETVPDLVGAQLNDALDDLRTAGFDSQVTQVFASEPSGVVVKQEPQPGAKLKEGAVVALSVSKGGKPVAVPDVVGQATAEASATLREAGFEVNVVPVPSREPAGTVVAQSPAAGATADTGTAVRLNVAQEGASTGTTPTTTPTTTAPSTGSTPSTVPDVVGQTQAQATTALHDVQLKPQVQFVPSTQVEVGTVVAQAREPGTTLEPGGVMQINISVGPEKVPLVAVPNVLRLPEAEARTRLRDAGFTVQVLREATDDPSLVGTVVDRQPARGPEGGLVTIWVGRAA